MAGPQYLVPDGRRGPQHAGSLLSTLAVFDFDGTITRRDSLVDFVLYAVPRARLFMAAPELTAGGIALLAGGRERQAFKEQVLRCCFGGLEALTFEDWARAYAASRLPRLVRPRALQRLRWHLGQGHRVVITTASLEAYVRPFAHQNGLGEVIGSRVEIDASGLLTGRLVGRNCYGFEKVARLRGLVGDLERHEMYVYGDSPGDRELLALATHAAYKPFRRGQVAVGGTS